MINLRNKFKNQYGDIVNLKAKAYSFDVFDTVLTRITGTPKGVFMLVENKLKDGNYEVPQKLVQNFTKLRIQAELEARQYSKGQEIKIVDIYKIIAKQFQLSSNVSNLFFK